MTRRRFANYRDLPVAERGPDGRWLCRECRKPIDHPRRTAFCNEECRKRFEMRFSANAVRRAVWDRDHGVCAICGVDTMFQVAVYRAAMKYGARTETKDAIRSFLADAWDIPWRRLQPYYKWWDADHIRPVAEGGGECGLENFRTLCIPCHKAETAALRRRMAERSKATKSMLDSIESDGTNG